MDITENINDGDCHMSWLDEGYDIPVGWSVADLLKWATDEVWKNMHRDMYSSWEDDDGNISIELCVVDGPDKTVLASARLWTTSIARGKE